MNAVVVPRPSIGDNERLGATLVLSLLLHGLLVLGVGFALENAAPVMPTLDVILTQTSTTEPPKDADFIAQANNKGGGDREVAQRPRESLDQLKRKETEGQLFRAAPDRPHCRTGSMAARVPYVSQAPQAVRSAGGFR